VSGNIMISVVLPIVIFWSQLKQYQLVLSFLRASLQSCCIYLLHPWVSLVHNPIS
jgi:hypothetical protein